MTKYPRPSLLEHSKGTYQLVEPYMVPSAPSAIMQEWELPIDEDGTLTVVGLKLKPATISSVKVFLGSASQKAMVWSDSVSHLMGVWWSPEVSDLNWAEIGDDVADEAIDRQKNGFDVGCSIRSVLVSATDGVESVLTQEHSHFETYWTTRRYYQHEKAEIFEGIARHAGSCTNASGRSFASLAYKLGRSSLAEAEVIFVELESDQIVRQFESLQELESAAAKIALPIVRQAVQHWADAIKDSQVDFTAYKSGDEPYREATTYRPCYSYYREYLNRGKVVRTEVYAHA